MEKKEEALAAIDALNGTMYKGRQLAVELSKAQPLINQLVTGNSTGVVADGDEGSCFLCHVCILLNAEIYMCPCTYCVFFHFLAGGLLPRPPPSLEHHQSQAAVLAAAAAAAAGLPIQVSFFFFCLLFTV